MNETRELVDLEAVKARYEAATPGPWWPTEALGEPQEDAAYGVAAGWTGDTYVSFVVATPGCASYDCGEPTDKEADADFIAAARTDVPALVAELEHLRDLAYDLAAALVEATAGDDAYHEPQGARAAQRALAAYEVVYGSVTG